MSFFIQGALIGVHHNGVELRNVKIIYIHLSTKLQYKLKEYKNLKFHFFPNV